MKISKQAREDAALILALCASGKPYAVYVSDAVEWLGLPIWGDAHRLAFEAVCLVEHESRLYSWDRWPCAEAESRLREGWTP